MFSIAATISCARSSACLLRRPNSVRRTRSPGVIDSAVNGAQDTARGAMNSVLHTPQTTPGKYAETLGEFLVPGGVPSKVTRAAATAGRKVSSYLGDLVGNAAAPAAISETAGQLTQGTAAEPWARFFGAIGGNLATTGVRAASAPETVMRRVGGGPDDPTWDKAFAFRDNVVAPTGIQLSGPELLTAAKGGASALPNLLRVVEGSVEGRDRLAPFFAARPAQVDAAVGDVLGKIAPQSTSPSSIGPRASAAAERVIASSPESQALADAVFNVGPRTTPLQAGQVIQPALANVFDRREGMRSALADHDYEAARHAPATIPVEDLVPETTTRRPAFTRLDPYVNDEAFIAGMVPERVPAVTQTPSMTSRTGGEMIQVDARPVVQAIDDMIPDARAETATSLRTARNMLFRDGGVDTSVRGLDAARGQIGDMITTARQGGQMQAADMLGQVRRHLDQALSDVPEYANARQNFQAASAPLEPFQSPGMAKTVERDQFNRGFATPAEQVPAQIATPSEASNFNQVAPPDARTAMENQIATRILDAATDANTGNVSAASLASTLRSNQDLLSQFPGVTERLQGVLGAANELPRARIGPVGDVAAAADTTAAGNALLPHNPLVGSEGETANAVRQLSAQDPAATSELVRQIMGDRFSRANIETKERGREAAGGNFYKDVAGSPQRRTTLDAALNALPDNSAAQPMSNLLDVLQATNHRKAIGSATAFNKSSKADMGSASVPAVALDVARTLGANLLTRGSDIIQRAALRRSLETLADMFAAPNSLELMREAAGRGATVNLPGAVAVGGTQGILQGSQPAGRSR